MTDFKKLAALPGLITADVGFLLYMFAKRVPADENIVELGSYHGKSTCFLASGARDGYGAHVFAVDAWSNKVNSWSKYQRPPDLKKFMRTIKSMDLNEHVTAVRGLTRGVAVRYKNPKPVGLLYVDADHSEQAVRGDVMAWLPHMYAGSVVLFDDYASTHNPEVKVAVDKLCTAGGPLVFHGEVVERVAVTQVVVQ